jgi:RNA polymerase sigma factor (TIGR02999 family)
MTFDDQPKGVENAPQVRDEMFSLVYEELRRLAAMRMARESAGHTLQPTALVHEAWLRLAGSGGSAWKNRSYFFAAAAEAMRRILVEHARRKSRLKHGGGKERLDIEGLELAEVPVDDKILLIHEALSELEKEHPERAKVVVLKYFGGLTNQELAQMLGIGERTVNRHWLCAKQWLFQKIRAHE